MADATRFLPYMEAERLLTQYDIPLAPSRLVQSPTEACSAARELGLPVALKAISPHMTHKSDAGLVRLNIREETGVAAAAEELLAITAGQDLDGLLVQTMVPVAVTMLAGISVDPQFGPVLALGSGGVLVELFDDVALRLPPLNAGQVRRMIAETRASALLEGYRGRPAADVPALVDLLLNLSRLAQAEADRLVSLDLNPVMVLPAGQGVQVVDLRVEVRNGRGENGGGNDGQDG